MTRLRPWLFAVILLLSTTTVRASSPSLPPTPVPFPPLPYPDLQALAADASTDVVILSPSQDTFVANGHYSIINENFGAEDVLFVGYYDPDLAEMRTFVGYRWQPPAKLLDILEARFFFGVGGGSDADLPVDIYHSRYAFNEMTITWVNGGWWGGPLAASGALGEPGFWYAFDVTQALQRLEPSQLAYIGFAIHPKTLAFHHYKGTFSREADPELAPQLALRYRIDNLAPLVWFGAIPEWASTMYDHYTIYGVDQPDSTRSIQFELQQRLDGGAWQSVEHYERERIFYPNTPGRILELRLRAKDQVDNTSDWVQTSPIKLYSYDLVGRFRDHRGRPLSPVNPRISPTPWWTGLHPEDGTFIARLKGWENLTASPQISGYGAWENEPLFRYASPITITMPPADNLMTEEIMGDPTTWLADDLLDGVAKAGIGHNGDSLLLQPAGYYLNNLRTPALYCHRQYFDPADLNQPTLGLHYWLPAHRNVEVIWQDASGRSHRLKWAIPQFRGGSGDNPDWQYLWADLTPYRGQEGRVCLQIRRESNGWDRFYFDRITLGSTPSDLSISAPYPDSIPEPGQPFSLDLAIRNSSPYTATAQLRIDANTATGMQIQPLPVLGSDSVSTYPITVTAPMSGVLSIRVSVGKPDIDRTPDDNSLQRLFFVDPKILYLPVIVQ